MPFTFTVPKRKVLFAINRFDIGGAEIMVAEQIEALDKSRFEPHLLTIYKNPEQNCLSRIDLSTTVYHPLIFSGIFDVVSWFRLFRLLRKEKFDAVITNLFDTNLIVRTVAVLCRVPVILSYEHNIYAEKKWWQIMADRLLAKGTTKILVGSNQVKEFTSKQENISPDKFVVNFNSAKLIFGETRNKRDQVLKEYGFDTAKVYVTTAGRLIKQKGHAYLIEAAAKIVKKHPEAMFLIFGEGELKGELEKKISDLDITNNIRLMGIATMEKIIALTDIFAFPSLWEGLSIALVNMMNAGCPIVATKVSGTEEALVGGESGILVKSADADRLAEALLLLIENPKEGERLGQGAKARSELFSIQKNISTIQELIIHGQ